MADTCSATCTDACATECLQASASSSIAPLTVIATTVLVVLSGAFSGLTLGLMTLSLESLSIVIHGGTPHERRWARRIYPVRRRGNLLLCTLLLANTMVNSLIAILSAEMTSGPVGGLISTAAIVIFGEIIPMSICSRHGLRIGSASVSVVVPLMLVLLPITWPISKMLDCVLGREMRTMYNKKQLDKLFEMHMADAAITNDDRKLLSSALTFSEKRVDSIMTPLKDLFLVSLNDVLNFDKLKEIYQTGYTRIPVFRVKRSCIVGVIFAKDLILVDPNDEIPVASILPCCSRSVNAAEENTTLERMLHEMQSTRTHLWFVTASGATAGRLEKGLDAAEDVLGIVAMEDLIEELISDEIIDESDTVTDNISKKVVLEERAPLRIEFFEMLQRREIMAGNAGEQNDPSMKTADEVRALTSYLSSNVSAFKPPGFSGAALRRMVQRCPAFTVSAEEVVDGCFVYVRGVPASFCCLLLHGRLEIRAGNEGFTSEVGPWTMLGLNALTEDGYKPEFTAKVISAARVFVMHRRDFRAVPNEDWTSVKRGWSRRRASRSDHVAGGAYGRLEAWPRALEHRSRKERLRGRSDGEASSDRETSADERPEGASESESESQRTNRGALGAFPERARLSCVRAKANSILSGRGGATDQTVCLGTRA